MRIVRLATVTALAVAALAGTTGETRAQDSASFVVAVLPYEATDEGRAQDLQKEIINELDNLGTYTLVDQKKVNEALRDAGVRAGSAIPAVKALEIGRALDARLVARGELRNEGGTWIAHPVFVEVATRNTQDLEPVSDRDIDDLGEKIVEEFNARNQALKHLIFGRDYVRSENYERAITNFQQAIEYDPDLASAYYHMGEVYLTQGQLDPALEALGKAVEADPAYISAYHTIGHTYLEKGDTAQAKNFFEQLVRSQPNDCDIQIAYGYVMANQMGEVEKGLAAFEKAKSLCPENPQAYQYYAFALPEERRQEKIEAFKKYLELSEGQETDPELLEYLVGLFVAAEQFEEAKQTIGQALAADPTDPNLLLTAGAVRDRLGQYREAIEFYDRALAINPRMERALLGKALAYKELGNEQKYVEFLERAGRDVSRYLASKALTDAFNLLKAGRASAAMETARRAIRLGADACAGNYVVGAALYDLGKVNQGEDKSIASNQRSIDLFQQAIGSLRNASCGRYNSFAQGLINNSNQYIDRGNTIIRKLQQGR